jgi:DNA polymerase III epsilon subunit-like protein
MIIYNSVRRKSWRKLMNYIVFDLELNSKPFKSRHPNEIIEIGAVKLNRNLEITGTFQSFVKPKVYKKAF